MKSSLFSKIQEVTKLENQGEILSVIDPMPSLREQGLVTQVGNGLFVLRGKAVKLLEILDAVFAGLATSLNADPIHVPSLLSPENTDRSQYLNSFLEQAVLLHQGKTKNTQRIFHSGMSCPTICYHYFSTLNNQELKSYDLVTGIGRCSRFEDGRLDDLSRLQSFTMREIIGVGSKEYCKTVFDKIYQRVIAIFSQQLDLTFSIQTASDPFFGNDHEMKKKAQLLSESKYEFRAALPQNSETLSVASFNKHQSVFLNRFSIEAEESKDWESFCVGFGYERILFALFSQKGTDLDSDYYRKLFKMQVKAI